MRILPVLLVPVLLAQLAGATTSTVDFDPHNPASVKDEYRKIRELYKGDLPRRTQELDRLNREIAEATHGDELRSEQAIRSKYGPFKDEVVQLSSGGGYPNRIIDMGAWNAETSFGGTETVLNLTIDEKRYGSVTKLSPAVTLRRKGRDFDHEMEMKRGTFEANWFRVELAATVEGRQVQARFSMPSAEVGEYVVDVSQPIERGLITRSSFNLAELLGGQVASATSGKVWTVGEVDVPPRPITMKSSLPVAGLEYPASIHIAIIIGVDGSVLQCTITKSDAPELERAVMEATKNWKFSPAQVNGRPVLVRYELPVVLVP